MAVKNEDRIVTVQNEPEKNSPVPANFNFKEFMRLPSGMENRFAVINRMIARDLNDPRNPTPTFYKYTKDQIATYLANPYRYEKELRNAVIYLYGASAHFRRLIQYFVSLNSLAYVVSPTKIDTATAKPASIMRNYKRVLNLMSGLNAKDQLEKVLTVALREDVFYGTLWETTDSTIIQQLPSDYCAVSTIEDNVLNVTFDFSYFDQNPTVLPLYPPEFEAKYNLYKSDMQALKWQELDAPNSFAIKCNKDILAYALPVFAGILREIYDLEDYKSLKLTKEELQNYALLVMSLGIDDNGDWKMDLNKAKEFWHNLDDVLPDEVGSVLSPMDINKISFERTHTGDTDAVADAEERLFSAAGVSSLLFSNPKASANALTLSIKVDQALTYSIVKSIETMLNRFIHRHSFGKYFKVTFLDVSPFNRKEQSDAYLKAASYGMPVISYYCAANGILQDDMDCLNFLEDDVLHIKERFRPLTNSAQMGAEDTDGETGRPKAEIEDLTDAGEAWQEGQGDEESE